METPLHPFIVHLPIGFSALLPLLAVAGYVSILRGWIPARGWGAVVAVQALICVVSLVAMETGEQDLVRVEGFVPAEPLEEHAGRAQIFYIGAWILLGISAAGLFPKRAGAVFQLLTCVAVAVQLTLVLWVGKAGGDLVYLHGAAEVPMTQPNETEPPAPK